MNDYEGYLREKSCGAVVYKVESGIIMYLLIKHLNGGHWSFPKGHVEFGENETQTAEREVLEETGLNVEVDTAFRFEMEYSPVPRVIKKAIYFVAESMGGIVVNQPEEVIESAWFDYDEAFISMTHDESKKLITEANIYIKKKHII